MAEDFDPDAYLKSRGIAPAKATPAPPPGEDFNPDAYLRSRGVTPVAKRVEDARRAALQAQDGGSVTDPDVGHFETFVNRATDTLPLGRLLVNLLSTGVMQGAKALGAGKPSVRLTPEAQLEAEAMGLPAVEENAIPGLVDTYRLMRDTRDFRTDVGSQQNPWTGRAGTAFGALLSAGMPLPAALGGGSAARQLLEKGLRGVPKAAGIGAGMGALQAIGDSRADLTSGEGGEIGQQVLETGLGAGLGAAGGALTQVAPTAARLLGQRMQQWGTGLGRRVLQGGGRQLTTDMPVSDAAVRESLRSGAIVPFGSTPGTYRRLEGLAGEVGAQYGDIIAGLEARGVTGPQAAVVALEMSRRAAQLRPNTMDDALVAEWGKQAKRLMSRADEDTGRLGLSQAEELKRSLQERARYGKLEETPLNEQRRQIASVVRQANEDAIQQAAERSVDPEIIERAESFVPVKQRLGRVLEAREAAKGGAQRTGNRGLVGLGDTQIGQMAGGLGPGLAVSLGSRLVRGRLPSAAATGMYWGGEALQGLSGLPQLAARTRLGRRLGVDSTRPQAGGGAALSDVELEDLSEWLAGLTGQGAAATEAEQSRAAVEALRRRRR